MRRRTMGIWTAAAVLGLAACSGTDDGLPYDEPEAPATVPTAETPGAGDPAAAPGTTGPARTLDTPGASAPGTPAGAATSDTILPLDTAPGAPPSGAGRP